jgi:hypothetical protein
VVYYLGHPPPRLKNWWVVYKVNPEMYTHRYDEYKERHKMISLMSTKKKSNDSKISWYLTGQDLHNYTTGKLDASIS